jgi:hypothetical protein
MVLLIESGARVNCVDNDGKTALFRSKTAEAVELLHQHGVDPRIRENNGKTAFQGYKPALASTTRQLFVNWTPHQKLPGIHLRLFSTLTTALDSVLQSGQHCW